jgi:uncharacterized protein YndB with AHSA1/START domain
MKDDSTSFDRKGQVTIEGDHATIVFKRMLRHKPQNIWNAITKPEELKEWLFCTSARIDGRAGGSVEMVSGPAQFHVTGKILIWDPPRVYEHEWKVAPRDEMPKGENATFRYELKPLGDHTVLTVTYKRITSQTARGFAPGGHVLLDRLEAQLDGQPLPGWMPRFMELAEQAYGWKR